MLVFLGREHKLIVRNRRRVFFCGGWEKHERRLVNMQNMFCRPSRLNRPIVPGSFQVTAQMHIAQRKTILERIKQYIADIFPGLSTLIVPFKTDANDGFRKMCVHLNNL